MHSDMSAGRCASGGSPPTAVITPAPGSVTVAELAIEAERALRALADATADLRTVHDDLAVESMRAIAAGRRFLESAQLSLVGELDARSLPKRIAGLGTRQWLGHQHGWSSPTAARQIHVARKCRRELPLLADALRAGRLSFEHVMFIAYRLTDRTREFLVEMQPVFIDLVDGRRFEKWAQLVDELIQMADNDGAVPPDTDDNRAVMSDLYDGQLHLRLDAVGAEALETQSILLAELERRFRAHRQLANANPEHRIPARSRLLAEAHLELLRRGQSAGPATKAPITDVTLVIHASDPVRAHTRDGVCVQDGTTRLLTCDSVTHAVVVDRLGVPLDQGRAQRHFDPDQIRAIRVRDGGCVHPGCDAPVAWTQIHHIDEYRHDDGPTDLANGVALCPIHHSLLHHRWSIRPDDSEGGQGFIFTSPTGRELRSQRHGQPRP